MHKHPVRTGAVRRKPVARARIFVGSTPKNRLKCLRTISSAASFDGVMAPEETWLANRNLHGTPRDRTTGVYPLVQGARYTSLTIADTHIAGFCRDCQPRSARCSDPAAVVGRVCGSLRLDERRLSGAGGGGFFPNGGKSHMWFASPVGPAPERAGAVPRATGRAGCCAIRGTNRRCASWRSMRGRWGNSVWVKTTRSTGAKTLLTLDPLRRCRPGRGSRRRAASKKPRAAADL